MAGRIEISKKLILFNSISGIVSKILNILLLIWLNQFLIKNISVEEYSIYPVAMSIMMFVVMLRSVLSGGLARHITEAYAKNDINQIEELTSTGFIVQLTGAVIVILLGIFFVLNVEDVLFIDSHLIAEAKLIFGILIVSFGIRQLFIPFEAGLQVKQKFMAINFIELFGVVIRILIIAILFKTVSIKITWVVIATEIAQFIGIAFRINLSHRNVPEIKLRIKSINLKRVPELLSFSFWMFIVNFASRIQSSIDPLFLNRFSDPFNITCFHIGSLFKKQIQAMQATVVVTFIPALTAMHVENDSKRIKRTYIKFGKYFIWAYMLVALPLVIFRNDFIRLYLGEEYFLAARVMVLLLFDSLFILGNTLTFYIAMAVNKVKKVALFMFAAQLFNICMTTYLVGFRHMGALGSASATFLTNFIISTILLIPIGLRLTNTSLKEYISQIMLPGFIPSFILFIPLLLLEKYFPPVSWFYLILIGIVFAVFYIVAIYFVAAKKDDIESIKKVFKRKI